MRSKARIGSHPIHPMLVVFPLGLWIAGFGFDLCGVMTGRSLLWAAGYYSLVAGCLGAAAAALAGATDLLTVVPRDSSGWRRGLIHGGLNAIILLGFLYVVWRRGGPELQPDNASLMLAGLGVAGVLFSGWLGATLVYRNQIGVDHRYANAGKWRERTLENWNQPVCKENDLAEGQMMLVLVNERRIVVGRCPEGFVAFSDHCTHRGGPLSDGALVGCTVQCPWHGSQFDATTGEVVNGPAKKKIDAYEVDVRNGQIFVTPHRKAPRKAA